MVVSLILLLLGLACAQELDLVYLFELARHGARAPLQQSAGFPVPSEMLTPQGMRQRYLLGRYNFETYGQHLPNVWHDMKVQSTDVYRTI